MADVVRLDADSRTEFGKGAARRTRRAGKVPAVMYGHGGDPRHISLDGHAVMLALKNGSNRLLTIAMPDGGSETVLPRQVVRDPIKGFYEHLDLLVVRKGELVNVEIGIHLQGESAPGTILDQQMTTLSVEADATEIPDSVTLDVEGLAVGERKLAGDIELPAGVTLLADPEALVVHAIEPRGEVAAEGEEPVVGEPVAAEDVEAEAPEGDVVEATDES